MEKVPSLRYSGQSSSEILALSDTHDHLSLLYAFEWGLQAKGRAIGGETSLNDEERLVLAVLALDREVSNGGFHQFFTNSSYRFAPIIAGCLRRIGCDATAAIAERAIAAVELPAVEPAAIEKAIAKKNPRRDRTFEACDKEYSSLTELVDKLFAFVRAHQSKIHVPRTDDYPRIPERRESSNVSKLEIRLRLWKRGWDPAVEEARKIARKIARIEAIPSTELDFEAAAILYCFDKAVRLADLERGRALCQRAFELTKDEASHQVVHKAWVEALISKGCVDEADNGALEYLRFLKDGGRGDQSEYGRDHSVMFWARFVKEHRAALLRSLEFFQESFPAIKLDEVKLIAKFKGPFPMPKKPIQMLSERPEFLSDNDS
ncbi:MAG TPA: DUF4375 domain-containing protein [Terracidiphilus sp.]|jgi:hypothetical protein|nr:DUF4375 domain-containing protein [Terracidiphilus sp.]